MQYADIAAAEREITSALLDPTILTTTNLRKI
jgi:hypothetical protein